MRVALAVMVLLAARLVGAVEVGQQGGHCTPTQTVDCGSQGGTISVTSQGVCECWITTYTPRKVTNALKGDVGLVPLSDGRGEETVAAVMGALVQNHRHAVTFLSTNELVHNTSLDDMEKALQVFKLRLDPAVLMNGWPGIVQDTVDGTYRIERLGLEGLVLKPIAETTYYRGFFENAANEASSDVGKGYYKISDYTNNTAMAYTWSSDKSVDRRGTTCSGLVYEAFTRAGTVITRHTYPEGLRATVAQAIYDSVYDQVPWAAGIVGLRNRIANQVTNCFGAFGRSNGTASCDDSSNTWESAVGSGTTISPDNLLRVSQTLQAGSAYTDTGLSGYTWARKSSPTITSAGPVLTTTQLQPGDTLTSSMRCSFSLGRWSCTSYGATNTPFYRVELQNMVGGTYSSVKVF